MRIMLVFVFLCLQTTLAHTQDQVQYALDRIVVQFEKAPAWEEGSTTFQIPAVDELNQRLGVERIRMTGNRKTKDAFVIHFGEEHDIPKLVDLYLATGFFRFVEPDYRGEAAGVMESLPTIPSDTYFNRQYSLYNDGGFFLVPSTSDADIDMDLAWDYEQGSSDVIVAILDSGLRFGHPEFQGRIWENSAEVLDGLDNDNNGYVDDVRGWNFAYNDNDISDDHGHGTNVTGIIGANGQNNLGYAGVDWNCQLMTGKILDENNTGYYSWWADAIYYAVDNGADVINMSVGGQDYSNLLQNAVDYAYDNGVTIVACMMNYNNSTVNYPAGFANTIAVGSTDPMDQRSSPFNWSATSGSNYGDHIDVVAPGSYIYGLDAFSDSNYDYYWSGTSQATPHVAGLASLLLAQDPSRSPDDIRQIIRVTAEDQVGRPTEDSLGFDIYHGYGRINAHDALTYGLVLPVAGFQLDANSGCAPLSIQATDTTTESPTSWAWTVTGPEDYSSSDQNPSFTLNSAGTYIIELTATNADGSSTDQQTVTVDAAPVADFNYSLNNSTVQFTNSSGDADSYAWDFGDGNTSTMENPSHTYANSGTYTVTLAATNACGTDNHTAMVDVTVTSNDNIPGLDHWTIHPNPNHGRFTIHLESQQSLALDVVVYDLLGREMWSVQIQRGGTEPSFTLGASGQWPAGTYWVRLTDGESSSVKRMVVR